METIVLDRVILGFYRDSGKENGNYYIRWGYIGVILVPYINIYMSTYMYIVDGGGFSLHSQGVRLTTSIVFSVWRQRVR